MDAGEAVSYSAAGANGGVVTGGADGKFTYTPNKDFNGTDTVVVTVTDKAGATATQTVTINVAAVNDAPTVSAATQNVSGTEDTAVTFTVSGSDFHAGDSFTYAAGGGKDGQEPGGQGGRLPYSLKKA